MGPGRRRRLRAWRVRVFLAMALGAFAARCSVLTSFDSLTSGSAEAGRGVDASSSVEGSTDAASAADVSAADGATSEAGSDGGALDAKADAGFCASLSPAPKLCDDFDEPDGGFAKWSLQYEFGGGTLAIDSAESRSAPSSLLVSTPATANNAGARLAITPPGTAQHVSFGFDLKVDTRDPQSGYAEIGYIVVTAGFQDNFYLRIYTDPTNNAFTAESYPDGASVPHNLTLSTSISFDTWRRVVVDVDLATAHAVTVTVDGVMAAQQALEPTLYMPGKLEVRPGIGYAAGPSSGWALRYDNVTVDWN
jgi:hypothetical protein